MATSISSLSYKWYRNGNRINGATSSSYILSGVTVNDAGFYSVEVKNTTGYTAKSRNAQLIVTTNSVPVAVNDTYSTGEENILVIAAPGVLANDVPRLLNPMTPELVATTSHGTLTFDTNGAFTYMPDINFFGVDTFTYRAKDSQSTGNVALVSINVAGANDPPVAQNDSATTAEGTAVTIDVAANDSDPDGTTPVIISTTTTNGTAVVNGAGKVVYTPAAGFYGTTTFRYTISDGIAPATATVSVSVAPTPPDANADRYVTLEDQPLSISAPGVLANDVDSHPGVTLRAALATPPANGTVALAANGSFTYTPNSGYFGADTFTYIASGLSDSAPAPVTIDTTLTTPLRFRSTKMSKNGLTAQLVGPRRATYTVFASTNEQDWTAVATRVAFDGTATFLDPTTGVYRFYKGAVGTQAISILERNSTGGATLDIRSGRDGAQSFRHGAAGDPSYTISKLVLRLSRTAVAPDTNLIVSIGSALNGGALASGGATINPATITNATAGTSFQTYEITYSSPVGPFLSGTTYYINLECRAPNGGRIYVETSGTGSYPNGTFYRDGGNESQDVWFELWGQPSESWAVIDPPAAAP